MSEDDKTKSRKWKLVLLVLIIATIGTFIPPMVSAWLFKAPAILEILTGGHFVTLITLVVSAYYGANVWQKNVLKEQISEENKDPKKPPTVTTTTEKVIETKIKKNEEGEA